MANRSENRVSSMVCHLAVKELPIDGSKSRRVALLHLYPKTKTQPEKTVSASFRTEDWRLCYAGHLSFYYFFRFDVKASAHEGGEEEGRTINIQSHSSRHPLFPFHSLHQGEGKEFDFFAPETWGDKVLFAQTNRTGKIIIGDEHTTYDQELSGLTKAASRAKVSLGAKKTHVFRRGTAQDLNDKGVPGHDTARLGGWAYNIQMADK
jgi:hypothetical protein